MHKEESMVRCPKKATVHAVEVNDKEGKSYQFMDISDINGEIYKKSATIHQVLVMEMKDFTE